MDRELAFRWNAVVAPEDRVYHLGDVAFSKTIPPLNGRIILLGGNHDDRLGFRHYADALPWRLDDIRGSVAVGGCVLTHIPVHPSQLERFAANIHGHLHEKVVLDDDMRPDKRYVNVSVEQTDYTPVDLSAILRRIGANA